MSNARVEADVRSLMAQNRFDEAENEIQESGVAEPEKNHLEALLSIGHAEKAMTDSRYASAVDYFAGALKKDPDNRIATRDDCLAVYRYFANKPFHPAGSEEPDASALKAAVDACKRTSYGAQVMPFISSNLKNQASGQ
jgi:tetratricopeptide (TPR) repeat protein